MGVVIEICVKHPGGPPRIKGTDLHSSTVPSCSSLGAVFEENKIFGLWRPGAENSCARRK